MFRSRVTYREQTHTHTKQKLPNYSRPQNVRSTKSKYCITLFALLMPNQFFLDKLYFKVVIKNENLIPFCASIYI